MAAFLSLAFVLLFGASAANARFVFDAPDPNSLCPKAIFAFSDSLSDTGNRNIEAGNATISGSFPYGVSLGFPNGRYCDGWVINDILNQILGIYPYSIPSLAYNNSYFTGLDFGYAGATVLTVPNQPLSSPHNFSTQVDDFLAHQESFSYVSGEMTTLLLSESLYFIQIGGDDINFHLPPEGAAIVNLTIPRVIEGLRENIMRLYVAGARRFLLFNMPRADCSPTYLQSAAGSPARRDELGCLADVGLLIYYFNQQILELATELNANYTDLTVHYFDWFEANTVVLRNMDKYGFKVADKACCGSGPGDYNCGGNGLCGCADPPSNFTVCSNPEEYITFDGVHYTQKFYQVMADFLMNSQYLTPPLYLIPGCGVPFPDFPAYDLPIHH